VANRTSLGREKLLEAKEKKPAWLLLHKRSSQCNCAVDQAQCPAQLGVYEPWAKMP
jgi:hypothetical protein